jgi:hypothetical protein
VVWCLLLCSVAHTQTTFIGTAHHSHTRRSCPELLSVCKIPYSYFYLTNYTPAEHSSAISHFQICRGMLGRRVLLIDDDSCSTGDWLASNRFSGLDPPPLIFECSVPSVPCVHVFLASDFFHTSSAGVYVVSARPSSVFRGAQNILLAYLLYRQYERLVGYVVRSLQ